MENDSHEIAWFEAWFNTPYYHILYKQRNDDEAHFFVRNLVQKLQLTSTHKLLDLACGKGRHSIFLNQLGFEVLGVDLSINSIGAAQQMANERLQFKVHDMREVIEHETFDVVLNLFTSFGYFDNQTDNLRVLNSIHTMLKEQGKVVIDFFNLTVVLANMQPQELKVVDGISFHIEKHFDGNHIFKQITFEADGKKHQYVEKVQGVSPHDFENLLTAAGFEVENTFGDFALNPFQESTSDRFIIVARKK